VSRRKLVLCCELINHRGLVAPQQFVRLSCGVTLWDDRSGSEETAAFVSRKLRDVLHGRVAEHSSPPPIDLVCSHLSKVISLLYFDWHADRLIQNPSAFTFDQSASLARVISYTVGDEISLSMLLRSRTPISRSPLIHTSSRFIIHLPLILSCFGKYPLNYVRVTCSFLI